MWKWIKIPKGLALVAFVLPWLTVSCSGTKIVGATGFGIAFGRFTSHLDPSLSNTTANPLVMLALIVVAIGFAVAFTQRSRGKAALVIGTSLVATLLIWVGTIRYSKESLLAEAPLRAEAARNDVTAAMAMIQVDWEYGYWLAILALLASAVMAWLTYSGREAEVAQRVRGALARPPEAPLTNCPQCGKGLPAGTRYCPDDGTALD
ncbi:hypothetical protein P1X14_13355 [Sphingomonas sp. AOB5]|uniref:hypothetical protein n=1 Tax=Sphingomonas sp. AOB5 TaxID=3034017 RepID=UPI0023F7F1F2|nr:hypothetical protein [Sphingomonas sp. AOB5]MDF7776239.1 hypothetical protein [Sphingomonas sp. AOB5]